MAKYFGDGTVLGAVYEVDDRFYYDCEFCSTSFSGSDEYKLELKADQHDREHHQPHELE
jgi:hypothetical protein